MSSERAFRHLMEIVGRPSSPVETLHQVWGSHVYVSANGDAPVRTPFPCLLAKHSRGAPGEAIAAMEVLLSAGIDVNGHHRATGGGHTVLTTVLHDALSDGSLEFVAFLLSRGADQSQVWTRWNQTHFTEERVTMAPAVDRGPKASSLRSQVARDKISTLLDALPLAAP